MPLFLEHNTYLWPPKEKTSDLSTLSTVDLRVKKRKLNFQWVGLERGTSCFKWNHGIHKQDTRVKKEQKRLTKTHSGGIHII